MTPPRRVLIAGCGYVGSRAAELLRDEGAEVLALRRSSAPLPEGVIPIRGDLTDPALMATLPEVDAVLYAAAAGSASESAYQAVYVDAVDALLSTLEARAQRSGTPLRFVFLSSTAVYGDAGGGWVDETTPPTPESWRGARVLEGEARVLGSPLQGVVLRLGGIYGPGRDRLVRLVRAGEARCSEGEPLWSNRIHQEDAAGASVFLLSHPAPPGVVLGVDEAPTPLCEVYRWLARELDAPEPQVDPTLTRDRSNKRCSSARLRGLGYAFRVPTFREGYRAMIEGGNP